MSATVLRSATVIVHNTTAEAFTIAAASTLHGDWGEAGRPPIGEVIPAGEKRQWTSISATHEVGTSAFLRLNSTAGESTFIWRLPWNGLPSAEYSMPTGLIAGVHIDPEPAHAATVLVVISEVRRTVEAGVGRRR